MRKQSSEQQQQTAQNLAYILISEQHKQTQKQSSEQQKQTEQRTAEIIDFK
jgi:hypothetical protein